MSSFPLKTLFFAALCLAGRTIHAQDEHYSFNKGDWFVSAGAGFPNQNGLLLRPVRKELNFEYKGSGPFHFKAEYAILDNLGVGISYNRVAFEASWKVNNPDLAKAFDYRLTYASNSLIIRLNGHYPAAPGLDIYGGFGVGLKTGRPKLVSDDPAKKSWTFPFTFPLGAEATAGARIRVADPLYIYVEAGLAKSFVQGGLSLRI
ncbi:MAG: hypothetical protein ACK5U7_01865 [Bacteroidota bacterium]